MSLTSLSLSTSSALQVTVSKFESVTTVTNRQPSHHAEHDRSAHQTFRESNLVSAMMTAFQALGVAPAGSTAAVAAAAPATDSSAASGGSAASQTTSTPVASAASGVSATTTQGVDAEVQPTTATTSTAAAGPTGAADTLEKAVNAFAHALFSVMSRGGPERGYEHHGEGHRVHGGGYNGFAQRLEQLAQSLGSTGTPAATATAATPSASVSASSAPGTSTTTVTTTTSDHAATPALSAAPITTHSRGLNRLLATFTQVMSLLQPPPATQAASPDVASTSATSSAVAPIADSMMAKLQLFLHTLAQALQSSHADASPSALGSRVNLTA